MADHATAGTGGDMQAVADLGAARDRALVRRMTARDAHGSDALATLFRTYSPNALALARRVTRQDQLAEDVVQEAFLSLWRSPDAYQPDRGTVRAYLMTAVHHRAVDAVRREQAQRRRQDQQAESTPLEEEDVAAEVTDRADELDRRYQVVEALRTLPDEQRRVVSMMYYDGKTQRDIAAELQVPLGTVKSRTLLAMRKLRTALGEPARRQTW